MVWTRPDNIPFPSVWERFEGRVSINGKKLQYRIQDITDDLVEPILDHMFTYFRIRERCLAHDGVAEDEEASQELRHAWKSNMEQRMGLVAIVEGEGEESKRIAGVNILQVVLKSDVRKPPVHPKVKRLMEMFRRFYDNENLFEKYKVDKYLNAFGLSVAPQYQGDSVGYYLLKARTPLCIACDLSLTVTFFSNPAATYSAVKAGFEVILKKDIVDLKIDGERMYPRLTSAELTLTTKVIQ